MVQSLHFINLKFQASSHLLWLFSPVCVGLGKTTSSQKGCDTHLRAIIQSEKKWKHQFFRRSRAASSVVHGRIWPNFNLIQALMYVIITCKYEKDPIKNNREKKSNTVFQIITLFVAMETSGPIWPNFELILTFMHALIAGKYGKDQMKNSGENVMTSFLHYKSMGFFSDAQGQPTPWSMVGFRRISKSFKLLCISSLPSSMK